METGSAIGLCATHRTRPVSSDAYLNHPLPKPECWGELWICSYCRQSFCLALAHGDVLADLCDDCWLEYHAAP